MNKHSLVEIISDRLNMPHDLVCSVINTLADVIADSLLEEERVVIQNFGSFRLWHHASRPVRNPKTGEPMIFQPRNSVKFVPGKHLVDLLNRQADDMESDKA